MSQWLTRALIIPFLPSEVYLALRPSYHTAPMLKVDALTAGSDGSKTRRQEKRGRPRAKAESGSASRLVKLDEIFSSVPGSQS